MLPGALFAAIADSITSYSFVQDDLFIAAFAYYFIGLVISRIGSLIVEPLLRRTRFVRFAEYQKFIAASKVDEKLEVLSETNNMYRTLCALFLTLFVLVLVDIVGIHWPHLKSAAPYIGAAGLLIMFLFAYKKQTSYITRRIESAVDKSDS